MQQNETEQSTTAPGASASEEPEFKKPEVLLPTLAPPGALANAAAATPAQEEAAINPRSVLNALRRRWFIILTLGLSLGVVAAYGAWELIPAPYTAYSEVRIKTTVQTVPLASANREPQYEVYKQTHMQLVKSREVLEGALRDPKVAGTAMIQNEVDVDQVEWLREELEVTSVGPEFFRIILSGDYPEDQQTIVKAVAASYKENVVDKEKAHVNERLKSYQEIRDKEEGKLEALKKSLYLLIKEDSSTKEAAAERQKHLLELRADLHQRMGEVKAEISRLEFIQSYRKEQAGKFGTHKIPQEEIDAQLAGHPEFRKRHARVEELKSLLKRQKAAYTKNHPAIKKTVKEIAQAETALDVQRKKLEPEVKDFLRKRVGTYAESDEKVRFTLDILRARLASYQKDLDELKGRQREAGLKDLRIESLGVEIEQQQSYTQALRNEVTRMLARLELADEDPRIIISDTAEVSARPDMKKKYTGTAFAGFGTFGFILVGIVLLDIRLKRISSLQQVVERVGLPILGTLPAMPRSATSRRNGRWSSRARYWHGVLTESVDSARTLLVREADKSSLRVIMVASAMGGEGKTTVACHLATSLARAGRSVLLIDGDLRRPFVHRTFETALEPGLAETLRGEAELPDCLQESGVPGMTILPAGRISQKALEILAQDRLEELLAEWQKQFDFIVIDTAPVLPVTDSLLIAQYVDGVIVTIRRDVSRAAKVQAACERMTMLGVPMLGAVAVGLDDESYGYRYPYRYGYGYGWNGPRAAG